MKRILFTIADSANMKYAEILQKSLRKFHKFEDLPLEIIGPEEIKTRAIDPLFFYRATPILASEYFNKGYDQVIKIDADSIICGDLSPSWETNLDLSVVFNSNPRDFKNYPYTIWDIPGSQYLNCGYIVMNNKRFVEHWIALCFGPHFPAYQMKEQDLLNIMCHYGDYTVNLLDMGDSFWGLSTKGYWQNIEVENDKLVLHPQEGYNKVSKWVKIIHWGGGSGSSMKMNYHTQFSLDVIKWLDKIVI